jgi:hypothetical protein
MSIRKVITAAAIVAGAVAFSVGGVATAEAAPKPEHGPVSRCWPVGKGHTMCRVWQYRCPGEPFPPLSVGIIQPCKNPNHQPRQYWRVVRY